MRVVMLCIGSRGDVQPMAALGTELSSRGHDVVLAVPSDQVEFARSAGLTAVSAGLDMRPFFESEEGQALLAAGRMRAFMECLARRRDEVMEDVRAALTPVVREADVIVTTQLIEDEAAVLAQACDIPVVAVHFAPVRSNRHYPPYLVTTRRLPAPLTLLAHHLVARTQARMVVPGLRLLREELGLPASDELAAGAMARTGAAEIQAYSRLLMPELDDWDPRRRLVGFLQLTAETRLRLGENGMSPQLARWFEDGDPPVYVGFGSMPLTDPAATLAMVRDVTGALGLRALVSAGWSRVGPVPGSTGNTGSTDVEPDSRVRVVGALDHTTVLPLCRAAVHHGGAGTTAASLGAGLPTLVASVFFDQPMWGRRLERLGVGRHLPLRELTPQNLGTALERLLAPPVAVRARRLGEDLRRESEGAAGRAARIVERAAVPRSSSRL